MTRVSIAYLGDSRSISPRIMFALHNGPRECLIAEHFCRERTNAEIREGILSQWAYFDLARHWDAPDENEFREALFEYFEGRNLDSPFDPFGPHEDSVFEVCAMFAMTWKEFAQ